MPPTFKSGILRAPMKRHKYTKRAPNARTMVPEFVEAYIACGRNGTLAAKQVGFAPKSADVQAAIMMKRADVRELLAKREAEVYAAAQANTGLTVEKVLGDLNAAQEFDPRSFYREDGTLKHPTELTLEQARQIEGWEVEEVYKGRGSKMLRFRVIKVKLSKRLAVRDQGMRHLGLYAKDNAQRTGTPEDTADKVRARLAAMEAATTGGTK